MKHKKRFALLLGCFLLILICGAYYFAHGPVSSSQTFAIAEDGTLHELESETIERDDFQLALEEELERIEWVDRAIVSHGRGDATAVYRVSIFGQDIDGREDDIVSYLEQHLDGYSVGDVTSYEARIDLTLE